MYEPTGNAGPVAGSSPWMPDSDQEVLWAFLDTAPVALLAADGERRIVRVNNRWCDLTGYEADAATGMRIDDLLAPESRPGIEMRWNDLMATGLATARIVLLRPDHVRVAIRYGAFANVLDGVHVAAYLAEPGQDTRALRPARRAGQLTRREQESLRLVAMGMTTTAAAEQLGISPETVRTHVRNAMNKLGARTRAQAIAVAMRDGEIPA